jgi:hypothetical protein
MIGKNMKIGAVVFGLAVSGGVLAGSVLGSPGVTSAASSNVAVAAATVYKTVASTPSSTSESTDSTSGSTETPAVSATPETPLTGDVLAQVTAAAQAAVPDGTIVRVETDNDGVYEAHMTRADGTEVIVQVGADYAVTATVDRPHGGRGGPGNGETALTGDTAASVTAAAQAAIPDGTIIRVETDRDGSPYEAHVTKADGTQVVVKVDASFAVTSTEDMPLG